MCSDDHFPTYSRISITEENDGYYFIYYLQISVQEGIDTDSLEPHREESNRKCCSCFEIFIIKKNFTLNDKNCNQCHKIRSKFCSNNNEKMLVLWNDNALYRVFTNLCLGWAERILRNERYLDKYGYIKFKKNDSLIELLAAEKERHQDVNQLLIFLKLRRTLELHCISSTRLMVKTYVCKRQLITNGYIFQNEYSMLLFFQFTSSKMKYLFTLFQNV